MAGALGSRKLGSVAINAGSRKFVVAASLDVFWHSTTFAARVAPLAADIDFGFNMQGASHRHNVEADMSLAFACSLTTARRKIATIDEVELLFDVKGDANRRTVGQANIAVHLAIIDKMQFAYLHRAPRGRVMVV